MWHELRHAARQLRAHPGFTLTAVLTLALGLGAGVTTWALFYGAALRPAPFPSSGRLMVPYTTVSEPGRTPVRVRWSYARLGLLHAWTSAFEALGGYSRTDVNLSDGDTPERVGAEVATSGYFAALRVPPLLGRTFTPAEDSIADGDAVVILSYDVWRRRWAGDTALIGGTVRIDGLPLTVVGVMPPGFSGLTEQARLWIPPPMASRATYDEYLTTNQDFISAVARLRPGVTVAGARSEVEVAGRRIQSARPSDAAAPGSSFGATLVPLNQARVNADRRTSLLILLGAVGLVLLLSCANTANLLLGRAALRRREIAVRIGLGASRWRVMRQLCFESLLLAAMGTAVGLLLAQAAAGALSGPARIIGPAGNYGALGEFAGAGLDPLVVGSAAALGLIVTVLFGLIPAVLATRVDLARDLRGGAAGPDAGGGGRLRLPTAIVVVETAVAFVVVAGASLMIRSLQRLDDAPLGFDPTHVLSFRLSPSAVQYPPTKAAGLYERILAGIEAVPGVESATVDGCTPLTLVCANTTLFIAGQPLPPPGREPEVMRHYVGPHHFATLRIPLLRGRTFTAGDRAGRPGVVVVNQTAARRFWPGRDPLGQRVWFGGTVFDAPERSAEVIGVVGDTPDEPLTVSGVQPAFYSSYLQFTWASRYVMVRTSGAPMPMLPTIRRAVHDVDPGLPVFDAQPLSDRIRGSWAAMRYNAGLLTAFGAMALVLATVGLYGVLAQAVTRRTREVGIRLAIGATPGAVRVAVLKEALGVAGAGLVIGALIALGATRVLRALLYKVSATDPVMFGALAVFIGIVALAAAWLPASRAARLDPVEALRHE
jgi:putative ABC transport system permease protein